MPVTYISATGGVSFDPVTARDQAVGPLEVADGPSPPDETIEPFLGTEKIVTDAAWQGRALLFPAGLIALAALLIAAALL